MNNEPTIQDVLNVLQGFSTQMDKRFDIIDNRFDGIDKRFDGIDKRFIEIDKRFDGVDKRFIEIDKRFDGIDKHLDAMANRHESEFAALRSADSRLDERLLILDKRVSA